MNNFLTDPLVYTYQIKTYHLLPPNLVEQFSLLAGQNRISIALDCLFDLNGQLIEHAFQINKITNRQQLTYEQVDKSIESKLPYWMKLKRLITLVRSENPIFSGPDVNVDSHLIVETMMILYNYLGTQYLINNNKLPILRIHPSNLIEKDYPEHLNKSLREFLNFLDYQSAYYVKFDPSSKEEDRIHFGLGIKNYSHLTSPMRRIVDAYNQSLLIQLLTGNGSEQYLDLEKINEFERNQRKFYRRSQIYQIANKMDEPIIKDSLFVYSDEGDNFYKIYWPRHKISARIKIGDNDPKPILYEQLEANIAIIHNPLPRLRINLTPSQ